jgi:hypothetical protein
MNNNQPLFTYTVSTFFLSSVQGFVSALSAPFITSLGFLYLLFFSHTPMLIVTNNWLEFPRFDFDF